MIIQPYRSPWKTAFPDVVLHASESIVKQHPAYLAAKSGDTAAALVLIADTLSDVAIQQLQAMQTMQIKYAMRKPILISVHAEEAMGKNAIPEVMADVLAAHLDWAVEANVVQANVVNHTGADGYSRMARQAIFSGDIEPNQSYIIVDDFIGQGGTVANLRGHIEHCGGFVIGATILTGKPFSATVALSLEQLQRLRSKHGHLESWWFEQFGFGFDCLTQSEARYLERSENADVIRNRILAPTQA